MPKIRTEIPTLIIEKVSLLKVVFIFHKKGRNKFESEEKGDR